MVSLLNSVSEKRNNSAPTNVQIIPIKMANPGRVDNQGGGSSRSTKRNNPFLFTKIILSAVLSISYSLRSSQPNVFKGFFFPGDNFPRAVSASFISIQASCPSAQHSKKRTEPKPRPWFTIVTTKTYTITLSLRLSFRFLPRAHPVN